MENEYTLWLDNETFSAICDEVDNDLENGDWNEEESYE